MGKRRQHSTGLTLGNRQLSLDGLSWISDRPFSNYCSTNTASKLAGYTWDFRLTHYRIWLAVGIGYSFGPNALLG
jgi:hypothetical protein